MHIMGIYLDITRKDIFSQLILLVFHVIQINCDMYTSLSQMEHLISLEQTKIKDIKDYIAKEEKRLTKIKRFLDEIESINTEAVKDPITYLSHPINTYTLLRRFRHEWREIDKTIIDENDDALDDYVTNLKTLRKSNAFPKDMDLKGAERAILRLQETYQFTAEQIARGELIHGDKSAFHLSALDCLNIGLIALEDDIDTADEWIEEAIGRFGDESSVLYEPLLLEALEALAFIAYKHGRMKRALNITKEILHIDSSNPYALHMKENIESKGEMDLYNSLCRGDPEQIQVLPSELAKCKYVHGNNPSLYIRPAKQELLSTNPHITLFHDVITDSEIECIKKRAQKKLKTGGARGSKADYRTNGVAWIDSQQEGDPLWRYLRRVQDYTGLSTDVNHREWIQVANYGIGGHYYPHYDGGHNINDENLQNSMGHRTATVLTYLSDVHAGGATVFLQGRVRVQPKRGTAVFWYNYLRNGDLDYNTKHAACPVVIGTKWAANVWLREFGQVFRRKCSMNAYE